MSVPEADVRNCAGVRTAIIVGAGFGGLGMAIALRRQGIHDFLLLEKAQDVGGVWRDNSYPGAACDIPSHLYSFSFEPNPRWSRVFAPQGEILDYLRHCARHYALGHHIRFGCEVSAARYDEARSLWAVTLADGSVLEARLLITATGQLSRPSYPALPGMDSYAGKAFHSARWDHDYALDGKRVAVIGTGASAAQFVPAIAERVAQLTVFQRSPAHMLPRPDRAYRPFERALYEQAPWLLTLRRLAIYATYESRAIAFTRYRRLMAFAVGRPFLRLLERQVQDPALRAKLVPDYPHGCKRILLSSDYLKSLGQPQVALCTERIVRVTPTGIDTDDGRHHAVDAIIYGTGFAATDFLAPMAVHGRDGRELNAVWRDGAKAWMGMAVPGFPNFFMLYGPNTNLGHNSIVYMLESQIAHVMRCVRALRAREAGAVEVQAAPYAAFNAGIEQRLAASAWTGCRSWYVDARGHNSTNWPGFTFSYRWLAKYAGLGAYTFSGRADDGGARPADS